jgi:hypothetical protein
MKSFIACTILQVHWVGGVEENAYRFLVGMLQRKRHLGRMKCR